MTISGAPDAIRPRMRPLDPRWIEHQGEQYLVLQDRAGILERPAVVPWAVAMILSLCDGTRTVAEIHAGFEVRAGVTMSPPELEQVLTELDDACVLDGAAYQRTVAGALARYRSAPHRPPSHAGSVYPADPTELARQLAAYAATSIAMPAALRGDPAAIRGIVSPHIDYRRGGSIYAMTWAAAAPAVRAADVIVIFGTDHVGGAGRITLTRQRYATPWGPLPTLPDVVDRLAAALGEETVFAEELHHRSEHSVELAAVWVHHLRRDDPCPVLPILCGSFHRFTEGQADAAAEPSFETLIETLNESLAGKRVVYVAAADFAHVGPAFGDERPWSELNRAELRSADERLIGLVCAGDAAAFLGDLVADRDRRRICGLPPIYFMLRALGSSRGSVLGYDQCPADPERGSFVSIAGALLW